MKITSMPKVTLSEMLGFIAENERFSSVEKHLRDSFTVPQVRGALRELADGLMKEAASDGEPDAHVLCTDTELSSRARDIISSLTPAEEQKLLAAFGLVSK